jgi:acyl-CoA thioester hydrolase
VSDPPGVQGSPRGYVHRIRVRYGEVDMQRVVFNAHYLAYCDDAVERWLATKGVNVFDTGWDFMLKKAVLEWQGSATVHDTIDIAVEVSRWGTTSFDVLFTGTVDERPVFTNTITYVGVKLGTTETMAPPEDVKRTLSA